jgi:hypothetical protein
VGDSVCRITGFDQVFEAISTWLIGFYGLLTIFRKGLTNRVMSSNQKGEHMVWEYCQLAVKTKGWIDLMLPEKYLDKLNHLAIDGWEVDTMVPIHTGISGTTTVIILMKRERKRVQS